MLLHIVHQANLVIDFAFSSEIKFVAKKQKTTIFEGIMED